jgi:hypothetical protein
MTMNLGFIPTYDATQEVINFMVEMLQKTTADMLAVELKSFCQIFGYPPCRKFVEKKNVTHEIIGATFTYAML